ncbi:hypothetical protein [Shewanella inventionis]|nr:hypothetical protein [Shewanella inventionis]
MTKLTVGKLFEQVEQSTAQYLAKYLQHNEKIKAALMHTSKSYLSQIPAEDKAYFQFHLDQLKAENKLMWAFVQRDTDFKNRPVNVERKGIGIRFQDWLCYADIIQSSESVFLLHQPDTTIEKNCTEKTFEYQVHNESWGGTKLKIILDCTPGSDVKNQCVIESNVPIKRGSMTSLLAYKFTMDSSDLDVNDVYPTEFKNLYKAHRNAISGDTPFSLDAVINQKGCDKFEAESDIILKTIIEHFMSDGEMDSEDLPQIREVLSKSGGTSYSNTNRLIEQCCKLPTSNTCLLDSSARIGELFDGLESPLNFIIRDIINQRYREVDYNKNPMDALLYLNEVQEKLSCSVHISGFLRIELLRTKVERAELKQSLELADALDECIGLLSTANNSDWESEVIPTQSLNNAL